MGRIFDDVGAAFCNEKVIVAVDSEEEAQELLRSCESYRGVGIPDEKWGVNSGHTMYVAGRAYRFNEAAGHPNRGLLSSYLGRVQPGEAYEGYRIVRYSDFLEEVYGEQEIECDVRSLIDSVTV